MRKLRILLIIMPLLLCCAATGLYMYYFIWQDDLTPPVITIDSEELSVSVSAADEELLTGVSAWDELDGDVSENIVVESVSNITEDHRATVVYAAFDRAGNVSKAQRDVYYADYSAPVLGLSHPLVFQEGASADVLSCVTAQDMVDGNLSGRVKGTLVSDTISLNYAGVHQVEFRVTNSLGDTTRVTLPVDVYPAGSYNAALQLTDYLITIKTGSDFIPERYLECFKVGTREFELFSRKYEDTEPEGRETDDAETDAAEADDAQDMQTQDSEAEDGAADGIAGDEDEPDVIINLNHALNITEEQERKDIIIEIDMDDDVNVNVPGLYSVTYTVTMNNYTGYSRLNVIVEE